MEEGGGMKLVDKDRVVYHMEAHKVKTNHLLPRVINEAGVCGCIEVVL
jgi:hypothetical protein